MSVVTGNRNSAYGRRLSGSSVNLWLRSANRSNGNNTWNVNSNGYLNNNNANNAYRCLPDCERRAASWLAHSAGTRRR